MKFKLMTSAAVALTVVLSGCGATERQEAPPAEGRFPSAIELADDTNPDAHFRYAFSVLTGTWDPTQTDTGNNITALSPVYDRLVHYSPEGEIEPMLATEWEPLEDGGGVVLHLREGVTFSDGTPFDAAAVKVNLDRAKAPESKIAGEISQLQAVEVIHQNTVKLVADTGAGALLGALTQRAGMMASPAAISAGTLTDQPTGTGPYTLTTFSPGVSASYAKRDGYWAPEVQNVATMEYLLMGDDQTRLNALNAGEIDGAFIRSFQAPSAEDSGLQVISRATSTFLVLTVNAATEPLDDPKVREALNYGIDRVAIGDGFLDGMCTPQIQPWPDSSFAYDEAIGDGLDIWPHDVEEAKKLLTEAGYPDGFKLEVITPAITLYQQLAEIVQEQLSEIGVDISITSAPSAQVIQEFTVDRTVPALVGPYTGIPDPHGFSIQYLLPGGRSNPGEAVPPPIIDLATQASTPVEPKERAPLYHELMQAIIDEPSGAIPICANHLVEAYADEVSGVAINSTSFVDHRGVGKK